LGYIVTIVRAIVPNPMVFGPDDAVYLVLYATGLRHAASVAVTINGVSVPVGFAGAQGVYDGLDQLNVGPLPTSLAGAGSARLVLVADGQTVSDVTVEIR